MKVWKVSSDFLVRIGSSAHLKIQSAFLGFEDTMEDAGAELYTRYPELQDLTVVFIPQVSARNLNMFGYTFYLSKLVPNRLDS